jgi:AcrR family transcriptional regulator
MGYKKSSETKNRILKAAAMIFTERGYYETGIGDIAMEAGIGRASFYYYFDDKEKVARALFDSYVERIYAAADKAVPIHETEEVPSEQEQEALILSTFVKYILLFKYVAMNDATRAVYFDLVNYADYDSENIERLERTAFKDTRRLAAAYGKKLSDAEFVAFLVTSNSVAKCIFKAKINGILDFSLLEAADYFFSHAILPDIPIPEHRYRILLAKAFELCEGIILD